ncbi:hypothetical protein ACJIZ3_013029 [Penstemon smallii]|uniref:NADH-ubiquinone oxidoreductase 21kDa subunit N-terminal domain-containing protein n=1 Tax=Penstemon smallii TaxID=265156 RepID=A0ABD3UNQ4_9LAMI
MLEKMNTDITASVKPEYPVIDRNPPFTKTVSNFNTLDYFRLSTITGVSVVVGYLSAGNQGSIDGDWGSDRSAWRFHVRVPEFRWKTHGVFPQ